MVVFKIKIGIIALFAAVLFAVPAMATTYYVDGENGSDSADGTSWDTARKTIAKGLALASEVGDEVVIAAGTYSITASMGPSANGVTVRGATGKAADVILDGGGTKRIFNTSKTDCVFRDFTIQNAYGDAQYNTSAAAFRIVSNNKPFDDATTLSNIVVKFCSAVKHKASNGTYPASVATLGNNVRLLDCAFIANTNVFAFGAVYLGTNAVVRGCRFEGNVLDDGGESSSYEFQGGAFYAGKGLSVSGCAFVGNRVTGARPFGGAVATSATAGTYSFEDCVFSNNVVETAGTYLESLTYGNCAGGGAVASRYMSTATATTNTFTRCVFSGNVATATGEDDGDIVTRRRRTRGGAILGASSRVDCIDCSFLGNSSSSGGSAIQIGGWFGGGGNQHTPGSGSFIDRCEFRANVVGSFDRIAEGDGSADNSGTLLGYGTDMTVRNCLFACNTNWYGCAAVASVSSSSTGVTFDNLTVVGNAGLHNVAVSDKSHSSYGIALRPSSSELGNRLSNCISVGNHNATNSSVKIWYGGDENDFSNYSEKMNVSNCYFQYSRLTANAEKGIQKGSDPGFTDAANGDYTLLKTSACRNAGANQSWMAGAKDLAGKKRINERDGSVVDLGCYEWYSPNPAGLSIFVR